MVIINLEPVYGILLSLAVWGEEELLSSRFYLGFVVILATILMNGYLKRKKLTNENESQL